VSCALLAGGGMRTGQVIGSTTRDAGLAKDRPVTFGEVHATLYRNVGIDVNTVTVNDLSGRPQYLVDGGAQTDEGIDLIYLNEVMPLPLQANRQVMFKFFWSFFLLALCLLAENSTAQQPKPEPTAEERANQEQLKKFLQGNNGETPLTKPPSQLGFVWTKLFDIEAEGAKFVFVFDRSASMSIARGKPMAAAKRELIASLAPLERVHQFYLIFYNQAASAFQPGAEAGKLIFATESNKQAAEKYINGIQPEGATDHYLALSLALKMRPDVIFLLTDGDAKDDISEAELAPNRQAKRDSDQNPRDPIHVRFCHGTESPHARQRQSRRIQIGLAQRARWREIENGTLIGLMTLIFTDQQE
jgi:hypothetical protein